MKLLPSLVLISSILVVHPALAQSTDAISESLDPVMCTMDVKQCPDGSFVGRTGPQCEFICPTSTATTDAPPLVSDPAPQGEGAERDRVRDSETARAIEAGRAQFEENQAVRQDLRSERRSALSEIRQQRIINLAANISNRMDAAVDRLFTIIGRLESRIQKLKLEGVDTGTAELSLQEATRSIAEARALLSDIDTKVYEATTGDDAYTAWQELRTYYQTIAALIQSTHAALRETISLLKAGITSPRLQGNPEPEMMSAPDTPATTTNETLIPVF